MILGEDARLFVATEEDHGFLAQLDFILLGLVAFLAFVQVRKPLQFDDELNVLVGGSKKKCVRQRGWAVSRV